MSEQSYEAFFERVTGYRPYPYQRRLGEAAEQGRWPELLEVPTGLGKTAALVVAWMWGRQRAPQHTPRRLVYCLPMRVLVEQTVANATGWLRAAGLLGEPGEGKVSVHLLMGGADDLRSWAEHPEEDMVLVGTQDMLLSRALNRGYGMSRYQWPVHFGLLHSDALWVYDEVQLMGPALLTSAQLEAFRRRHPLGRPSRSLWASATLRKQWLDTVDLRPHLLTLRVAGIEADDERMAGSRLRSSKSLERARTSLNAAAGEEAYLEALAEEILEAHRPEGQTIVVLNRVERAQRLYRRLRAARPDRADLLLHARFRPAERRRIEQRLREEPAEDRIVVATQAIEAGVDVSSAVLFTELAPWSSLVQRFGRCNRYGEHNESGALVRWVDIEEGADSLPYEAEALARARARLEGLDSAAPQDLPPVSGQRPEGLVLRHKDLLELFSTHPDLCGFDVDVSEYIRDRGSPQLFLFWRPGEEPNEPEPEPRPGREELCAVPYRHAKLKRWLIGHAHRWDPLTGRWQPLRELPPPGSTVRVPCERGGYDPEVGFDPAFKRAVDPVEPPPRRPEDPERFEGDWRSIAPRAVLLEEHLAHVRDEAERLCRAVGESDHAEAVAVAAAWHDVGKAHPVFQKAVRTCAGGSGEEPGDVGSLLAKSPCRGRLRYEQRGFRHELWSMLAWLAHRDDPQQPDPFVDLVAFLVLAHHGKLRTHLRSPLGGEAEPDAQRVTLPSLRVAGEPEPIGETREVPELHVLGLGPGGRSWMDRVQGLLQAHGPFRLAWLEALVRVADWRASAAEQREASASELAPRAGQGA